MKKRILPALLSIVLLSSCSQALYKNSYDWVKVGRVPDHPLVDSLSEKLRTLPRNPDVLAAGVVAKVVVAVHDRDSSANVVNAGNEEPRQPAQSSDESVPGTRALNEGRLSTHSGTTAQEADPDSAADIAEKVSRSNRNIDWGGIVYNTLFFGTLFVLWYFRDNPVVALITAILEALAALVGIIATIWFLVWLCRIFIEFTCMMG